jgi:hypothetical protein
VSGKVFSVVLWHVGLVRTMPDAVVLDAKVQNRWHESDERYVRRAQRASIDATEWRRSLRRANRGRRGRPFVLPPGMLDQVRKLVLELRLSLRAAEGHLRRMLSALGMKAPDHITIWRRLAAETAAPVVSPRSAVVAIDSTGFGTTVRSEWLRDKWRKRRGFVKAHVAVDVNTLEVLAVVVTDDTVHDAEVFAPLVQQLLDRGVRVTRVLADGAYDSRTNFDLLRACNIEAGIKVRKNASMKRLGHSFARPMAVREHNFLGNWLWERRYAYSLRWVIEYVFSAVKRTLGGEVRSRSRDLMFSEVENKFWT